MTYKFAKGLSTDVSDSLESINPDWPNYSNLMKEKYSELKSCAPAEIISTVENRELAPGIIFPIVENNELIAILYVASSDTIPQYVVNWLIDLSSKINAPISRLLAGKALESLNQDLENRIKERTEVLARSEEKYRLLSEELEEKVIERTRELEEAHEELVRKNRLAVIGRISGAVSHELRNPLGAIKNATYFLSMVLDKSDSDVRESLTILDKEVGNCERIIGDLLDYARPKIPNFELVDANKLIIEVVKGIQIPDSIHINEDFSKDLPTVFVDSHQLKRVLINIIVNGMQAMPEGGNLTLRTQQADDDAFVSILVIDSGVGISKENQEKLFEPLFTTKVKGIGLGLTISKTLVEANNGSINVTSEEGKGTTFEIHIPASGGARK
jgi:signal transduction histidine kinase